MARDDVYWHRLRKDRRSNAAVLLAAVAALVATLSVISIAAGDAYYPARARPFYWLLMIPAAWWISGLARFEARAVRLLKPALGATCSLSVGMAVISMHSAGSWTAQTIACAIALAAAVASLLVHRGSLVEQERPMLPFDTKTGPR